MPRLVLAAALVLLVADAAWAGAPTDQLKRAIDKVIRILEDPALRGDGTVRERRAAIRSVADQTFDFTEMSQRALGRHWRGRTAQEREEFAKLFEDILERSYIATLERYQGEKIRYGREQVDGDFATVSTKITTKQGQDASVDYRQLREGDRWLVYDVVVEGVSLIANYRVQFNKIIETSSYAELVERMKAKLAGEEGRGTGTARK